MFNRLLFYFIPTNLRPTTMALLWAMGLVSLGFHFKKTEVTYMCCVGTKLVMRDFYYLVKCFRDQNALTPETACPYKQLAVDSTDHLFARDNFQSMRRTGAIGRTSTGGYFLADHQCLENFTCKFGK